VAITSLEPNVLAAIQHSTSSLAET